MPVGLTSRSPCCDWRTVSTMETLVNKKCCSCGNIFIDDGYKSWLFEGEGGRGVSHNAYPDRFTKTPTVENYINVAARGRAWRAPR